MKLRASRPATAAGVASDPTSGRTRQRPRARAGHGTARASGRALQVLSVLGDPTLANAVDLTLRHGGYIRRSAATLTDAAGAIASWKPHLVILDIDVEADAVRLIDDARAGGRIGVIVLARQHGLRAKLDAFERGADDYIGVPFVPEDLFARVRAVLRRTVGEAGELIPRLRVGGLEIDVLNRRVVEGDREIHLTSLEQALLYLLAANAGQVLSREQILDALWGIADVRESNVVDWHVGSLRAKLNDDWREPRYIETVPKQGYRFRASSASTDQLPLH